MPTGRREPFAATLQVHHGERKAFHVAVAITHRRKPGPLLGHPCAHASGLRQARKGSIPPRPCTGAWLAQRDMDRPRECRGHESFLSTHITQAQLEGLLLVPQTTDACQAGTQRPVSAAAGPSSLCCAQHNRAASLFLLSPLPPAHPSAALASRTSLAWMAPAPGEEPQEEGWEAAGTASPMLPAVAPAWLEGTCTQRGLFLRVAMHGGCTQLREENTKIRFGQKIVQAGS